MAADPARLYQQLLNTGLQNSNNPLYQLLRGLIDASLAQSRSSSSSSSGGSSGTGLPAGVAGDLIYNNGTTWVPLVIGTDGQVLTADTGLPVWGNPATVAERQTFDLETSNLGSGVTESGSFMLPSVTEFETLQLLRLQSDRGGFLVLYASEAERDADTRPLPATTDPLAGIGILMDAAFETGGSLITVSPPVLVYNSLNADNEVFFRFYNGELTAGVTTISLEYVITISGGGSSGTTTPHDILSATHSDTVAAVPVAGDILTYNGTNWVRFPAGTAGQVLTIVAGVPTWSIDGSALEINADNLISGVIPYARFPSTITRRDLAESIAGLWDFTGGLEILGSRVGRWTSVAYNAADYTSDVGTWTVDLADVETYKTMLIDKTLFITLRISQTTVAGTPGELRVLLPNGYTGVSSTIQLAYVVPDGILTEVGRVTVSAGGTQLRFNRIVSPNWINCVNLCYLRFTGYIEIN